MRVLGLLASGGRPRGLPVGLVMRLLLCGVRYFLYDIIQDKGFLGHVKRGKTHLALMGTY